jgi:translation initiation factor IF-3
VALTKKPQQDLPNINERIRYPQIRVVDTDGAQLGILTPRDALRIAQEKELKKAREARKKQHTADVKEVKMRYKIEEHDYNVRINHAERFLKSGDKVKATITFRGREIQHSHLAEELLQRMATDLKDVAEVQQAPKKEGRNMIMLLAPKK